MKELYALGLVEHDHKMHAEKDGQNGRKKYLLRLLVDLNLCYRFLKIVLLKFRKNIVTVAESLPFKMMKM